MNLRLPGLAAARGIGFVFDCPPTLPETVMTDPTRLRQILINLLSNAIKFTSVGEVRLAVRVPGQVAEFTVSDTGPGIAADQLARIFEPIYRQMEKPDNLVPVLEKYWKSYPPVYLCYLQNSQKAKRIRVLIEFLLEKMQG